MNARNKRSYCDVAFGGLAGFSRQDDTTKSRSYHQGMSVQTLNSPRSVYFSQTNSDQNNTHPINPLNKFRIAVLTQAAPDSFDELDLTVIPESMFDEDIPRNSDNESVDDTLFPTLCSDLFNQSCFSGNVPDIREPTPANGLNLDHRVTNLTAELTNPQNSRSVAVIYPLNLQQATSDNPANSAEIVDDKSSQVERKKKYDRDRKRERYRNDPAYAERKRQSHREWLRKLFKDPVYAEREKMRRRRRYQNDPVYAGGQRIYVRTYNRLKKISGKEEASKLASAARKEYLQSVNSSGNPGDLPQTSNPEMPMTSQEAVRTGNC